MGSGLLMTSKEYEKFVEDVWNESSLDYCFIGFGGEVGEVLNERKKEIRNNESRQTLMIEELGDTLYYLTKLAHFYGVTLEGLMYINKIKLEKRNLDAK